MAQPCARCGAETSDEYRFCSSCGAPLRPLEGAERKLATIVFADLVGSTELAAELDPEELRGRLTPFLELARATLEEHGGTVEKYIGDAVMAAFGVPRAFGDDADRAVAGALALVSRLAAREDALRVRIGVETGEVLALAREDDLAVTGETVNVAARLQQAAEPGVVLVGERAARSARAARLERHPPVEAKGFPAPLAAWRAVAVAEAPLHAAEAPFVGREDDIALLRLAYRRAVRQRSPQLVTVTGEAGIGKTRLANELLAELAGESEEPEVLLGRNPPYGRGIAFWALGEIVREAAGSGPDESVAAVRDALAARLEGLGADDGAELASVLAVALGGDQPNGDAEEALRRAWRRLVAVLAGRRPLVVGIDDAHWADESLLDLIEEIVLGLDETRLLVLCTSRPELVQRRPGFGGEASNVTRIELRPLAPEAATELAAALLPNPSPGLASRVAEASGGNPFFAEEMTRRIAEEPAASLAGALPETVQAAVAARLDLLPRAEKRAIQYAAVLGQTFGREALAELTGEPVDDSLEGLVRKALLQERLAEGAGRYAFRHQLISDVAYASLPRAERARLHERAAGRIVIGVHPELAELMAFHRVRAAELERSTERGESAYRAVTEAAAVTAQRGASLRAQHLYEQGAELAGSTAERLRSLAAASDVAVRRFRGDEALRLRREEATIAEEAGEDAVAAAAYARAVEIPARMGGVTGPVPEAEIAQMLARGLELVGEDDPRTRAHLLLDEAWIAWRFDRLEEMREPTRKGLALARRSGDPVLISNALDAASALQWLDGDFAGSVASSRERLELLERASETRAVEYEIVDARHMMISSLTQAGDLRGAFRYATQTREADLARGVEHAAWERDLLPAFYLGHWDHALEGARKTREAWIAAGRPPISAWAQGLSVPIAIHGCRGEERESLDWLEFLLGLMPEQTGGLPLADVFTAPVREAGLLMRGDVLLHHGRWEEAADLLAAAFDQWSWFGPTIRAVRAEAFVRAGRAAERTIAEIEELTLNHPYGRAVGRRIKGIAESDEGALREALAIFREIECPYQEARTGWLLGGEERVAAKHTLERLGVSEPGG
ncbi:MAG: family ATPase [Solirubrobacterales bacterium]|nr:family ATPase [Solirubrobacterales bacterium]